MGDLHACPSRRFACVLIDPRQCMTKPAGDHWPATGNVKAKDMDIDRFGSVVVAPALVAILTFIYFVYQRSRRSVWTICETLCGISEWSQSATPKTQSVVLHARGIAADWHCPGAGRSKS